MTAVILNRTLGARATLLFAGDYEVVGPDPALGHEAVASLSADMIFIHYHHRHEFEGGANKGLWGSVSRASGAAYDWEELDRTIGSANRNFALVAVYPVGWAHMVPEHLGETILDIDPEVVSDWVCAVVERYWRKVDLFPIFYEMNVFDLFFRTTHGQPYGDQQKRHILDCLALSAEKVLKRCGEEAYSKLTAATFVELTQSCFYWMSEGKLMELPRGSSLLDAPLSPPDLLATARRFDKEAGVERYVPAVRQLLHQLVFWNADDSGALDTVGNDMFRIYDAGFFYHPEINPEGFVHKLICGWDAQPQNTYEYLLERLQPKLSIPSCADQLEENWRGFQEFLSASRVGDYAKQAVNGFVLDDIFKCTKQSGITSAVYPTEHLLSSGHRHGGEPLAVSPIGERYRSIVKNYKSNIQKQGEHHGSVKQKPAPTNDPLHYSAG
ncbi:MAG: hypothetical protein HY850_01725 [Betaproteobacteria bacterium]|nr:hypothetical protein [Betaproteobacteria bacterium]